MRLLVRKPFPVRLWRSYRNFREVDYSHLEAFHAAWLIARLDLHQIHAIERRRPR